MATLAICETKTKASENETTCNDYSFIFPVEGPEGAYTWLDDDDIEDAKAVYQNLCSVWADHGNDVLIDSIQDCIADAENDINLTLHVEMRIINASKHDAIDWQTVCELAKLMHNVDYSVTYIKDDAGNMYTVLYNNEEYCAADISTDFADVYFDRYDVLDVDICDVTDTSIMSLGIKKYNRTVQVNCRKGEDPLEVIKRETGVDVVLYTADGNMRTL